MKKNLALICGAVVLSAFAACGSSGSGGSTTPTDASFPSTVGVDVSEVASSDLQNVSFSASKDGIPSTGSMSAPITTATNMADLVTKLTDTLFSGIANALNSGLTTTSTQVSGTAFGGTVKMDFSNYNHDIDGDGTDDPCSGTASITSTEVACFRAWFNDSRLMIGYIQTVPTDATIGKGKAITSPTLVADADTLETIGMGSDVMTYLVWDNTVPGANSFDGYMSGTMATGTNLTVSRIVYNSETTTNTKITLRTAALFATPRTIGVPGYGLTNVDEVLFNSQFLLTGTFLVFEDYFSYLGEAVAPGQNTIPFCGVMATGNAAIVGDPEEIGSCTTEGISLTGLEYPSLAASDASLTQFPSATVFPEAPTF